MNPYFAFMLTATVLLTMCITSIAAVVGSHADIFNRILWGVLSVAATWNAIRVMFNDVKRRATEQPQP